MKKIILISLLVLSWLSIAAQSQVAIQNYEEGKLKKLISKDSYLTIRELKITGFVNDKDMKLIEKLSNLVSLDFSGATINAGYFPLLPNLKTLKMPRNCNPLIAYKGKHLCQYIQLNQTVTSAIMSKSMACVVGFEHLEVLQLYDYDSYESVREIQYLRHSFLPVYKIVVAKYENFSSTCWYPTIIYETSTNTTTLNGYDPSIKSLKGINVVRFTNEYIKSLDTLDLSDLRYIGRNVFNGCSAKHIIFGNNIRYIDYEAFDNCNNITEMYFPNNDTLEIKGCEKMLKTCPKLKNIHFKGPVKLSLEEINTENCEIIISSESAINSKGNLTNVRINGIVTASNYSFDYQYPYKCNFIFDSTVTISSHSSTYKKAVFTGMPKELKYDGKDQLASVYESANKETHDGLSSKYGLVTLEPYAKKITKTVIAEEPGQILKYMSLEEMKDIDSLTLIGHVYASDINIISSECKSLKYLDLSKCIITKSPQEIQKQKERDEFANGLMNALGAVADAKYKSRRMSSLDYVYVKALTIGLQSKSDVKNSLKQCFIPADAFSNIYGLETVILPYTASSVEPGAFDGCENLKTVQLPPHLERIRNAFSNCKNLKDIDFPKTLVYLQGFNNCTSLTKVDLSQCTFEVNGNYTNHVYWAYAFRNCSNLMELRLPKGISRIDDSSNTTTGNSESFKIYIQGVLKYFDATSFGTNVELHFDAKQTPDEITYRIGDIYPKIFCPKGSLTAYYNMFSKYVIVEE